MACDNICAAVLNDLVYSCDNKSVGGLVQTVKLINRCDLEPGDWTLTRSMTSLACSHLIAYSGTDPATLNGVSVQGIPGKRLLSASFTSSNTDYGWYWTHIVNLFSQGLTREAICNLKALGEGAELIAIVEQNFKGTNSQDAFMVYGWDAGLKLGDFTYNSNENNGNSVIPLTSIDPDLEPYPPMVLFMTDYATTKTFFDTL